MLRKVNIQTNQIVTKDDFNNMGLFPRHSFDVLTKDAITDVAAYCEFNVVQTGVAEVTVGAGRHYNGGKVYYRDDEGGVTLDLLSLLPAVAKRIVTVVVYGNEVDTQIEPRTILKDVTTRQTEGQEVAVESRRVAYVDRVAGVENADPQPPALDANILGVAHVHLSTTGIDKIVMIEANRLVSLKSLTERVVLIEKRLVQVGSQIDTLKTDISGLQRQINLKADAVFVRSIAADTARLKEIANLPDSYTSYGADRFLDENESDPAFAGYSAVVEEGVRFPNAASASTTMGLLNATDARVTVNNNMALPAWAENKRISIVGNDGEYPLTQGTSVSETLKQRTETRTRIRWGEEKVTCTNAAWWQSGVYDPITGIFRRAGETWQVEAVDDLINGFLNQWQDWEVGMPMPKHAFIRVHQYFEDTVTDVYWDRVVTETAVNGSLLAQTFYNSQDGYLCKLNLFFTKKASSGNVTVAICEVDAAARPRLDAVLAQTTLTPANLNIYPTATPVSFAPVFTERGKRYAIVLISSQPHFVSTVKDNKYAEGTMFYSTDGAYTQGDLWRDIAFEAFYCRFTTPVVTVELNPLELAGGIDTVDMNFDSIKPAGTRLLFEVRVNNVWVSVGPQALDAVHPLSARPSIAQFRVTFIGTTDLMPALGLGATRSAIKLTRPAAAFTHVSDIQTPAAAVTTVELQLLLQGFDEATHDLTATLLTGAGYATVETADAVVDTVYPNEPGLTHRKVTFSGMAALSSYRIKLVGATTNDHSLFLVNERVRIDG